METRSSPTRLCLRAEGVGKNLFSAPLLFLILFYCTIYLMLTDVIYNAFRKSPNIFNYFSLASDVLVYGSVILFYLFWIYTSIKQKKINRIFFMELTLGLFIIFSLVGWIKFVYPEIRPISYYQSESAQLFDSFPSRHTAIASTLAFLVLASYFEIGVGFVMISILVGILRWASLMHWPIDVITGWFLGMLIAIFVNEITKCILRLKRQK